MNIFLKILLFVVAVLTLAFLSFLKGHYSNKDIVDKAVDIVKKDSIVLNEARTFCESMVSGEFQDVRLMFRKGWDSLDVQLYSKEKSHRDIAKKTDKPTFVNVLLWTRNDMTVHFKSDEYMIIDFPYVNYALRRSKLIYVYDEGEFIRKHFADAKIYDDLSQISSYNAGEIVYKINEHWLLDIE